MAKEAKNKEKKVKEKKHFLKDVKAELKKVIWPTPKQLFNNTAAVIVIVLIIGVIVFLLDVCFEKMNSFGVEKLKTIVQSTQNEEVEESTENTETTEQNTDTEVSSKEENSETPSEEINPEEAVEDSQEITSDTETDRKSVV